MTGLLTRARARWASARRMRRDTLRLASLPDHLLRDMGLQPGSAEALEAQIRY